MNRRTRVTRDRRRVEAGSLLPRQHSCAEWHHERRALNYYCQECRKCICRICFEESHRPHRVVDIYKAARRGKKELNDVIKKAEEEIAACEEEMRANTDVIKSKRKEIRAARREVTQIVQGLVESLRKHERAMLTKLDELEKQHEKRHATAQQNLKKFVTGLERSAEHGRNVLRRNINIEIVKEKKAIIADCKEILNSRETEALSYFPFVNYVADEELCKKVQLSCPGQLIVSHTDPSQSKARGRGLTNPLVGEEADISVLTRDSGGKQCYHKDDQVKVIIEGPSGEELETNLKDKADGRYKVTFTPKTDDTHDVMITVNGQPLTGSPWSVQVGPHSYQKAFLPRLEARFQSPRGIAISKHNEHIAVADKLNKSVYIFNREGTLLKQFGNIPDHSKNLRSPNSVDFTKSGGIIIVEENGDMTNCSEDGSFLNYVSLGDGGKPCSVSVKNDGQLIVCQRETFFGDFPSPRVKILDCSGYEVVQWFAGNQKNGGLPSYAIHHEDRFFVSYQKKHCVKVFSEDGHFLYNIGTSRNSKGQLFAPLGLAVDKFNNLVICDTDGCRLQVFTLEGRYVTSIEGPSIGFGSPQYVAVSKDGCLFVTDDRDKCVHILF